MAACGEELPKGGSFAQQLEVGARNASKAVGALELVQAPALVRAQIVIPETAKGSEGEEIECSRVESIGESVEGQALIVLIAGDALEKAQ